MESKVNYTLVGIFVLLLGVAGIIIPLWLSSGLNQQQYNTYAVEIYESVDGLSTNAPVNYNGVNVGFVKSIKLNPNDTQQVELLLNIKEGTPITTNTTATLQSQGVTGFTYVGLNGGSLENAKPLVVKSDEIYPHIKAAPSIRMRLDTALTQVVSNINTLSQQLSTVLNPENEKLFNQILVNSNKSTVQLQNVLNNFQALITEVKQNPSVIVRGKATPVLGPGEQK